MIIKRVVFFYMLDMQYYRIKNENKEKVEKNNSVFLQDVHNMSLIYYSMISSSIPYHDANNTRRIRYSKSNIPSGYMEPSVNIPPPVSNPQGYTGPRLNVPPVC